MENLSCTVIGNVANLLRPTVLMNIATVDKVIFSGAKGLNAVYTLKTKTTAKKDSYIGYTPTPQHRIR